MTLFEKFRSDPGTAFSLADVFLFAQMTNPFAAIPATVAAGYLAFRSTAEGKTQQFLEKIEKPASRVFFSAHHAIPFVNRIDPTEFQKEKPGSTMLMVGLVQLSISAGAFLVAALNPTEPTGLLAATAAGCFGISNIQVGLQLSHPSTIEADRKWQDVLTSPQFLDACGNCCSGLMAGLATSFGLFAAIPLGLSLGAAALVASGKIGDVCLNKGVPLGLLTGVAVLNMGVGAVNGNWLAVISNAFASNGERILTQFYNAEYQIAKRPATGRINNFLRNIYQRESARPDDFAIPLTIAPKLG